MATFDELYGGNTPTPKGTVRLDDLVNQPESSGVSLDDLVKELQPAVTPDPRPPLDHVHPDGQNEWFKRAAAEISQRRTQRQYEKATIALRELNLPDIPENRAKYSFYEDPDEDKAISEKWYNAYRAYRNGLRPEIQPESTASSNVGEFLLGVPRGAMKAGATLATAFHSPETAAKFQQQIGRKADQLFEAAPSTAGTIGEVTGGVLPIAGAALLPGGQAAAIAIGAAMGSGRTAGEAGTLMQGITPEQQAQMLAAGYTVGEIAEADAKQKQAAAQGATMGRILGAGKGALEAYGFTKVAPQIAGRVVGGISNPVLRGTAAVGVDAALNTAQAAPSQIADNLIAQQTYDPTRQTTEGVVEAMKMAPIASLPFAPLSVKQGNLARQAKLIRQSQAKAAREAQAVRDAADAERAAAEARTREIEARHQAGLEVQRALREQRGEQRVVEPQVVEPPVVEPTVVRPAPEQQAAPTERPRVVPTEAELRSMSSDKLKQVADEWGVVYDSPSLTVPRLVEAISEWRNEDVPIANTMDRLNAMSDKELWNAARDAGLKASNRETNIRNLLRAELERPQPTEPATPPRLAPEPARPAPQEAPVEPEAVQPTPTREIEPQTPPPLSDRAVETMRDAASRGWDYATWERNIPQTLGKADQDAIAASGRGTWEGMFGKGEGKATSDKDLVEAYQHGMEVGRGEAAYSKPPDAARAAEYIRGRQDGYAQRLNALLAKVGDETRDAVVLSQGDDAIDAHVTKLSDAMALADIVDDSATARRLRDRFDRLTNAPRNTSPKEIVDEANAQSQQDARTSVKPSPIQPGTMQDQASSSTRDATRQPADTGSLGGGDVLPTGSAGRKVATAKSAPSVDQVHQQLSEYQKGLGKGYKVGYNKTYGYFVEPPQGAAIPDGWNRVSVDSKGVTRYSTPELKDIVARMDAAKPAEPAPARVSDIDTPAQGVLAQARAGKKLAWKKVQELRRRIKDEPLAGNAHGLRVELMKAASAHQEYLRMERGALKAIEGRANELGQTTVAPKPAEPPQPAANSESLHQKQATADLSRLPGATMRIADVPAREHDGGKLGSSQNAGKQAIIELPRQATPEQKQYLKSLGFKADWNTDEQRWLGTVSSADTYNTDAPAAKQPWQMSRAEFDAYLKSQQREIGPRSPARRAELHREAVEQAIREGKIDSHPDYPDAKKPAPKTRRPTKQSIEAKIRAEASRLGIDDEQQTFDAIQRLNRQKHGGAEFSTRFADKLPGEVEEYLRETRPDLRKYVRVVKPGDSGYQAADGLDSYENLGPTWYRQLETMDADSFNNAKQYLAKHGDQTAQFLVKLHENWPEQPAARKSAATRFRKAAEEEAKAAAKATNPDEKFNHLARHDALLKRAETAEATAKEAKPLDTVNVRERELDDEWEFGGHKFRVTLDEDGGLILRDGQEFDDIPLDWLPDQLPIDKGTLRKAPEPEVPDEPFAPKPEAEPEVDLFGRPAFKAEPGQQEVMPFKAVSDAEARRQAAAEAAKRKAEAPIAEDAKLQRKFGKTESGEMFPTDDAKTQQAQESTAPAHYAVYGDKVVRMDYVSDPNNQFKLAGQRIADNNGEGYIVTPDGKVFKITKGSKRATPVTGEEAKSAIAKTIAKPSPSEPDPPMSIADAAPRGVPVERLDAATKALRDRFPGAKIRIVKSDTELPGDAQSVIDARGVRGRVQDMVVGDGTVYVIADNIDDVRQGIEKTWHGIVGHVGADAGLTDPQRAIIVKWARTHAPEIVKAVKARYQRTERAREIIAFASERFAGAEKPAWYKRVLSLLRYTWRRITGQDYDIGDVERIIQRAARAAERQTAAPSDIRFAVADEAGADTPEQIEAARKAWLEKNTDSPWFRRWFGNSKVVDAQGKPMVVYHGTPTSEDFSTFDSGRIGQQNGNDGWFGKGFYFTDSDNAPGYLHNHGLKPHGARIYPTYLNLKNPFVINDKTTPTADLIDQLRKMKGVTAKESARMDDAIGGDARSVLSVAFGGERGSGSRLRSILEANGYDGVIADTKGGLEYVAFRPDQIKSATGNRGTFDPANPDIRFSIGPEPAKPAEPEQPPKRQWTVRELQGAIKALRTRKANPEEIKNTAFHIIKENVPPSQQGKFLIDIRDAKTAATLHNALVKVDVVVNQHIAAKQAARVEQYAPVDQPNKLLVGDTIEAMSEALAAEPAQEAPSVKAARQQRLKTYKNIKLKDIDLDKLPNEMIEEAKTLKANAIAAAGELRRLGQNYDGSPQAFERLQEALRVSEESTKELRWIVADAINMRTIRVGNTMQNVTDVAGEWKNHLVRHFGQSDTRLPSSRGFVRSVAESAGRAVDNTETFIQNMIGTLDIDSPVYKATVQNVADSIEAVNRHTQTANDRIHKALEENGLPYDTKKFHDWRTKTETVALPDAGVSIPVTRSQRTYIKALAGRTHFRELMAGNDGKVSFVYPNESGRGVTMTQRDLDAMTAGVTERETNIANAVIDYMQSIAADVRNKKVYLSGSAPQLEGGTYLPMRIYRQNEVMPKTYREQYKRDLSNVSSMHSTVLHKNPIVLHDLMEIFSQHVRETGRILHMAEPIHQAAMILEHPDAVKVYGDRYKQQLDNFLADAMNVDIVDRTKAGVIMDAMSRNIARAALPLNFTGSIIRNIVGGQTLLPALIPFKHLAAATAEGAGFSPSVKARLLKTNATIRARVENPYYHQTMPMFGDKASPVENLSFTEAVKAGKLGTAVDAITVPKLADLSPIMTTFRAVELWVQDTQPSLKGAEFDERVTQLTNYVVRKTQNGTSALEKSGLSLQAKNNAALRMMLQFSSPVNKMMNLLRTLPSASPKQKALIIGSVLAAIVTDTLITTTSQGDWRQLAGDDERKKKAAQTRLLRNLAGNVGDLAYAGMAVDMLTGFDGASPTSGSVRQLGKSVHDFTKAMIDQTDELSDNGKKTLGQKLATALEGIATNPLTGNPLIPVYKLARRVKDAVDGLDTDDRRLMRQRGISDPSEGKLASELLSLNQRHAEERRYIRIAKENPTDRAEALQRLRERRLTPEMRARHQRLNAVKEAIDKIRKAQEAGRISDERADELVERLLDRIRETP